MYISETKRNNDEMLPKYISEEKKIEILKYYDEMDQRLPNQAFIEDYVEMIKSDDIVQQHAGLLATRKLISSEGNQFEITQIIIDLNLIPFLIQMLEQNCNQLQIFEAIWILTNVASGTKQQTQIVVKNGGIPTLLKHLNSENLSIIEQVFQTLGNISADDGEYRTQIIQQGGLQKCMEICENLKSRNYRQIINLCSWTIGNLCRGEASPLIQRNKRELIRYFSYIIEQFDEEETLIDACWTLQQISQNYNQTDTYQEILDTGIVQRLITLLNNEKVGLITIACLKIISRILQGTQSQRDYIINQNILSVFADLLEVPLFQVKKEVCSCISMIIAIDIRFLKKLINYETMMDRLYKLFKLISIEIKINIAFVYQNVIKERQNLDQNDIIRVVEKGALIVLGEALLYRGVEFEKKLNILQSLDSIFELISDLYDTFKSQITEFFSIFCGLNEFIREDDEDENLMKLLQDYLNKWKKQFKN